MKDNKKSLPLQFQGHNIYYGWVILIAGSLGVVMSIPGQTMGISVFTEHLINSLGVGRLELSMAYMFGTLGSALILPIAGRFLDKFGPRLIGTLACFFLAIFMILIAKSPYLTRTLVSFTNLPRETIALSICFLGFLGVRHFGQGQLTMASRTMMARWFERRRGFVLGISGVFVAFGFGLAPLILTSLINSFEWQNALYILSAASILMGFIAWIFYRSSPEDCGVIIDGGSRATNINTQPALDVEDYSFTSREALRTNAFWIFNFGMVSQALLFTAITFHMSDIAKLSSISNEKAFSLFLPVAIVSTIADLVGGYFSDRINLKFLLTIMQTGLFLGLGSLLFFENEVGFYMTSIGLGISNGLFSLLMGAAWPKLFGRKFLGSISGINMGFIVAGSALGPYIFSLGKHFSGTYTAAIIISASLPLTVAIASIFIKNPEKFTNA